MAAGDLVEMDVDGPVSVFLAEIDSSASASAVVARLAVVRPGVAYVGLVSADLDPLAEVLAVLSEWLREIVCFDSFTEPVVTGNDLAMRTLDELGFGQDFVYTVPDLHAALRHATDSVADGRSGWEGAFVVVLGPAEVLARVARG